MWKIVQLLPQCDFRTFPSIQGEAYVHLQSLPILNLSPATSTLFSVSIDLPFLDLLHKLYYIIHGFCVWFFSPSIMFLSFIHVATCVSISLFVHCYVAFQFKYPFSWTVSTCWLWWARLLRTFKALCRHIVFTSLSKSLGRELLGFMVYLCLTI